MQQLSRIGCKVALLEQVVAVTAVQTGAGKSQVAAYINEHVRGRHLRTSVVRHPMPYGAPLAVKLASRAGPKQPSHGPSLLCLMKSKGLRTVSDPTGMHRPTLGRPWACC